MSHAKLSASGSQRWILCPGSVAAEEGLPDVTSPYAEEGSIAHNKAANLLKFRFSKNAAEDENIPTISDEEMSEAIMAYSNYIDTIVGERFNSTILIEEKVSYDNVASGGFGTTDFAYIYNNHLHVIDFKYGRGESVKAKENTQLLLYTIGIINELGFLHEIKKITLHIVQPRTNNFDKWSLDIEELARWEEYLKRKAEEALSENAVRIPSDKACKYCKAKDNCPAIYNFVDKSVINNLNNELNDEQLKIILDNSKLIIDFVNSVEQKVYNKLSGGEYFNGYKLVKGKSVRRFKDGAETRLLNILQEDAYKKTLIGIIEAERLLDKEVFDELVYLKENKPLLIKEAK